jgi:hypothetical protein
MARGYRHLIPKVTARRKHLYKTITLQGI